MLRLVAKSKIPSAQSSIVCLETKRAADLGSLPHLQLIYSNSYSIVRLIFRW